MNAMAALQIASVAIALSQVIWQSLKASGVVSADPKTEQYVEMGLSVAAKAQELIGKIQSGSTELDYLTAEQLRVILMPATWDEVVERAKAKRERGD